MGTFLEIIQTEKGCPESDLRSLYETFSEDSLVFYYQNIKYRKWSVSRSVLECLKVNEVNFLALNIELQTMPINIIFNNFESFVEVAANLTTYLIAHPEVEEKKDSVFTFDEKRYNSIKEMVLSGITCLTTLLFKEESQILCKRMEEEGLTIEEAFFLSILLVNDVYSYGVNAEHTTDFARYLEKVYQDLGWDTLKVAENLLALAKISLLAKNHG